MEDFTHLRKFHLVQLRHFPRMHAETMVHLCQGLVEDAGEVDKRETHAKAS